MPFTPFHFGAGAAVHVCAPRRISFLSFGAANVLTDTEPLYYLLRDQWPIHRFFHTVLGALVVALLTTAIGVVLLRLARRYRWPDPFECRRLTIAAITTGALLGTCTHVGLDALMHGDVHPWAPFDASNRLLGLLSVQQIELLCIGLGVVGGTVASWRNHAASRPTHRHRHGPLTWQRSNVSRAPSDPRRKSR